MFTWQDIIIYIALAVIIYFLIKAFATDKMAEKYIILLTLLIVIIFIAITSNKFTCQNGTEGFDNMNPDVTISIYPGQHGNNPQNKYSDKDIEDMKNILGINKETYHKLTENEKKALENIKSRHQYDMVHTTSHPFNTVPLGTQLYGYTYLPPENWFRAYEQPPVCVGGQTNVESTPDPYISGLLEFDAANNTMGAMGIGHGYIKNKTRPLSK